MGHHQDRRSNAARTRQKGRAQMDYYDPARQRIRSEHDQCVLEDGELWFGHGMPCRYPHWHAEEAAIQRCDTCGVPVVAIVDGVAYDLVAETKLEETPGLNRDE